MKKKILLILPVLLLFFGNVFLNAEGDSAGQAEKDPAQVKTAAKASQQPLAAVSVTGDSSDKPTPSPAVTAAPSPSPTPSPSPEPTAVPLTEEEQLGQDIANFALGFWGSNYKYGGESPETGFDCSGLIFYVYGQFGYSVERVAAAQATQGIEVSKDEIRPGDVLCFSYPGQKVHHVGLYVGYDCYIHAMGQEYGVVVTPIDHQEDGRDYIVRRYIGCEELMLPEGAPPPTA